MVVKEEPRKVCIPLSCLWIFKVLSLTCTQLSEQLNVKTTTMKDTTRSGSSSIRFELLSFVCDFVVHDRRLFFSQYMKKANPNFGFKGLYISLWLAMNVRCE